MSSQKPIMCERIDHLERELKTFEKQNSEYQQVKDYRLIKDDQNQKPDARRSER